MSPEFTLGRPGASCWGEGIKGLFRSGLVYSSTRTAATQEAVSSDVEESLPGSRPEAVLSRPNRAYRRYWHEADLHGTSSSVPLYKDQAWSDSGLSSTVLLLTVSVGSVSESHKRETKLLFCWLGVIAREQVLFTPCGRPCRSGTSVHGRWRLVENHETGMALVHVGQNSENMSEWLPSHCVFCTKRHSMFNSVAQAKKSWSQLEERVSDTCGSGWPCRLQSCKHCCWLSRFLVSAAKRFRFTYNHQMPSKLGSLASRSGENLSAVHNSPSLQTLDPSCLARMPGELPGSKTRHPLGTQARLFPSSCLPLPTCQGSSDKVA